MNVMLAFSRDETVRNLSHFLTHKPLTDLPTRGCDGILPQGASVPLSGVQPFKGLSYYAAPLTFMYEDEVSVYFTLRAMYTRYWCRLNVLRSDESTILALCQCFEELVQIHDPRLFFHMIQVRAFPASYPSRTHIATQQSFVFSCAPRSPRLVCIR